MKHQYDKQEIAQLIDKFMAGTTSIVEEDVLAQYFRTHEVGEEWAVYKEMFALFDAGKVDIEEETTKQADSPADLNERLGHRVEIQPQRPTLLSRWMWPAVAACIIAVFILGHSWQGNEAQLPPQPMAEGTRVVYASATDTTYKSPVLVDEFIAKLAANYGIEQEPMDSVTALDASIVDYIYIFPDRKKVDVFGRLLQVACWYDNNSPGYQLHLSQSQFLFELQDVHEGRNHRWFAEKIGTNTFLYGVNAPIGTTLSLASYTNAKANHFYYTF